VPWWDKTYTSYDIICSISSRLLVIISSFLSQAGRLELTNAVFTAPPTFPMSTFHLPKTIMKQIDKFRKHYLWREDLMSITANHQRQPILWFAFQSRNGAGVLNLRTQNECLLLKHLHKFYNLLNVPWVQLVWDKYYSNRWLPRLTSSFRASFWYGGMILWSLQIPIKAWPRLIFITLVVDSFGLTFGMEEFCSRHSQNYFPLIKNLCL
jgi:hypothetical protein